ncbi:hypothetical protein RchiOBHm_Chr3g0481761 [Rosa chinensis]|uniref:Uncharacterized protein n=1 Tax=Rosa chinensis TaxID=74649 RepID=A0A2P6RE02_ROSCH|nr:hypothetical protein RchiOBHm_Chr3g0481761 [Rosa chinensis]
MKNKGCRVNNFTSISDCLHDGIDYCLGSYKLLEIDYCLCFYNCWIEYRMFNNLGIDYFMCCNYLDKRILDLSPRFIDMTYACPNQWDIVILFQ